MADSDSEWAKYGPKFSEWAKYGPKPEPQAGGAETLWRNLMTGLGAPRAEEYRGAGPAASLWERIKSAGSQAISQGAPTALTALGGVGPASSLGRVGLGAATGALSAASAPGTAQERLARAAGGAAMGAGLGVAGEAIGGAIAPRLAPDAATLARQGVVLSPGQMVRRGNLTRDIEERATSLPILGKFIADTRARSIDSFNRATINQALQPVGATVGQNLAGHDAIRFMGDRIGQAYQRVFAQVPRVNVDPQLIGQSAQIELDARGRPDVWRIVQGEWNHAFRNVQRLGGAVGPRGGKLRIPPMSGEEAQRAMSDLAKKARDLGRSERYFEREAGGLLGDARGAVLDAVERQYPRVAPDLRSANEAWAMAVRIENAAGRRAAGQGRFTPMDLLAASKSAARGVRRREFARGDSLLQQWAETAQRVLPSTLGESGTTPRAYLLNPFAWGAGAAGRMPYGLLASPSRSAPGPIQAGVGEVARRLPPAVSPYLGRRLTGTGPQGGYITGIGLPTGQ